jgi:hypothetical protein
MKIKIVSITLLLVVAVNALLAGYAFMSDPSGSLLNIPVTWLKRAPFPDFFIPGLVLFCVNGLLNLAATAALLAKWRYSNIFLSLQGSLLAGWIFVQIILLRDFNFLHLVFGAIGTFLFCAGFYLRENSDLK